MASMTATRDRVRAELTRDIKDEARRQLATAGADGLSMRAVARQLGMVSSALYRYFPSRDDLLTALIVDAYNALGAAAEAADTGGPDVVARWRAVCRSVRSWARAHPHEYALLYGSPVPGYHAPSDTISPAARVPLVLLGVLGESWAAGTLTSVFEAPYPSPPLAAQAQRLSTSLGLDLPAPVLTRALIAWTQLFGMISFELFGQLVGSVDPAEEFFEHAVEQMGRYVGLPA
jgi:AcrR family transcriptional regulator